MESKNDTHGSPAITSWVHRHRRLAKWLVRILISGAVRLLFYLKREQKNIDREIKKEDS